MKFSTCLARNISSKKPTRSIVHIPEGSNISAFGSPSPTNSPLIRDIGWNILEGEAWAVISGSGGGKGVIFETLLGHTRITPATPEIHRRWAENGGLYPFLSFTSVHPYSRISHVPFRQRSGAESGAFFDYTARYGALREDVDQITLRKVLTPIGGSSDDALALVDRLPTGLNLTELLDLPILTLSNGQTRRARIAKAILNRPEILLLDEPLAGLDPPSRFSLMETLNSVHRFASPRIILGLRKGEVIPSWITNVLEIRDGTATCRRHDGFTLSQQSTGRRNKQSSSTKSFPTTEEGLVALKQVNVSYGNREVLKDINWKIRPGERWHLQGSNGSGKTTLLALLTGDHPQSYVQDHLLLPSFSASSSSKAPTYPLKPRSKTPTAHLRRLIGVSSPEMFDAFPRRYPGMSVWEAVSTGFDGGFVPRTRGASKESRRKGGVGWVDVTHEEVELYDGDELATSSQDVFVKRMEGLREWRITRLWEVLECLGPASWGKTTFANGPTSIPSDTTRTFASSLFSSLSSGEQRMLLLMRALVGQPPLVLLDEAWSGMDESMVAAARRYLRGEVSMQDKDGQMWKLRGLGDNQAAVAISHWQEEIPWDLEDVQVLNLDAGGILDVI